MKDIEIFKKISNATTTALGLPEDILKSKSRKPDICLGRKICTVISYNKGIKRETIASLLNMDRTATYYYTKIHESSFDSCIKYAKNYTKALLSVQNFKPNEKVFLEKVWLIRHLKTFGVKNSKKPEIIFTLTSGKIKCDIYSDYYSFSDDYDNIKKAIEGYNCKLKWENIK
ncbi:MAG: hypothetical protein Unbinned3904contig1002_18 [Prokaryotic dsDNA virus sp.]|nr:MAG: hypothetical protein Unbinned3904contig1002_18 [Prokaryotic dsDNA virus sp.]|tara:strand:+ start:6429 stop:6944 length:516 start_codon:yes stop_codon:yes gene_type:complete